MRQKYTVIVYLALICYRISISSSLKKNTKAPTTNSTLKAFTVLLIYSKIPTCSRTCVLQKQNSALQKRWKLWVVQYFSTKYKSC